MLHKSGVGTGNVSLPATIHLFTYSLIICNLSVVILLQRSKRDPVCLLSGISLSQTHCDLGQMSGWYFICVMKFHMVIQKFVAHSCVCVIHTEVTNTCAPRMSMFTP